MREFFQHAIENGAHELGAAFVAFCGAAVLFYCVTKARSYRLTFVQCRRSMSLVAVDGSESGIRLKSRGVA